MLSNDLRQYFTNSKVKIHEFDNASPENFLIQVLGMQKDVADIEDTLEENIEMLSEAIASDVCDLEIMDIHTTRDILDIGIYNLILNTFLDEEDYSLKEIDVQMRYLYDEIKDEFIDISNDYPNKLKGNIDEFYNEAKNVCYFEEQDEVDRYSLDVVSFKLYYIQFKNKSKGRRIRKLYETNATFCEMMSQLGFAYVNGEFLYMAYAFLEGNGFYGNYISFLFVLEGIKEARDFMNIPDIDQQRLNGLKYIFSEAVDRIERYNPTSLINSLIQALDTKREVII